MMWHQKQHWNVSLYIIAARELVSCLVKEAIIGLFPRFASIGSLALFYSFYETEHIWPRSAQLLHINPRV